MMIIAIFGEYNFCIIDRLNREVYALHEENGLHKFTTDLKPMPNFDQDTFPYLLSRGLHGINLVDIG